MRSFKPPVQLGLFIVIWTIWSATELLAQAQPPAEVPIYPTWHLMDEAGKKQFLAGYLYGFREARSLGEIAVEYSKSKPQDLEQGLEKLLQHYKLTTLSPDRLAPLLDQYFESPERQQDSLRLAINRLHQLPAQ